MKVCFLDIDGVLNSVSWEGRRPKGDSPTSPGSLAFWARRIDPAAVARLNSVLERTGAKVVITSSWRGMLGLQEIAAALAACGFTGEVVGQTPEYEGKTRADEIAAWMWDHAPIGHWVVLDDEKVSMAGRLLVWTDYAVGLTDADAEKAVALLNWVPPLPPDQEIH